MRYTEETLDITVPSGQTGAAIDFVPKAGTIIRAKIFYGEKNNTGIINAGIFGNNKQELSVMQHIDNYRDRDSSYTDCKHLHHEGGSKIYFRIEATTAFTAAFKAQLILIYEETEAEFCQ